MSVLHECLEQLHKNEDGAIEEVKEKLAHVLYASELVTSALETALQYVLSEPEDRVHDEAKNDLRVAVAVAVTAVRLHHPERIAGLFVELAQKVRMQGSGGSGIILPFDANKN